jgi:hypothetical protein
MNITNPQVKEIYDFIKDRFKRFSARSLDSGSDSYGYLADEDRSIITFIESLPYKTECDLNNASDMFLRLLSKGYEDHKWKKEDVVSAFKHGVYWERSKHNK